jgi:hypothetical protein
MGYRGKLAEQQQARQLRRTGLPLADIATTLGVAKSSVSLWVRDVEFTPLPRPPRGRRRAPNALQRRKQAEVDRLIEEGRARVGRLSEREFLVAGVALYAGEGSKSDGRVRFVNSDPRMWSSSAPGCGISMRSTSPASAWRSIFTKAWICRRQWRSGRLALVFPRRSSQSRTGRCRTLRSAVPNTCMVASRSVTVAASPTGPSWG